MQQFEPGAFRSSKGFILKRRIESQIDRIISDRFIIVQKHRTKFSTWNNGANNGVVYLCQKRGIEL
jgi:hypothetical protein